MSGKRRPKVLIVDGDKESILALHASLYRAASDSIDLLLAPSARIAREILRQISVDFLVTDVDPQESSGVDLVCWAAIEFPEMLFLVQTSDDVDALVKRVSGLGCLRLMRKPWAPSEVLKTIHESIDSMHRLSGCFSALSAADLIQMLCLAQRTAALRISSDAAAGIVMVKEGRLVHASWGNLAGQAALAAILDAQDGIFRTTPLPDSVAVNIHTDWQYALMEAVRFLDERTNSAHRQTGSFPAIRMDDSMLEVAEIEGAADADPRSPLMAVEARKMPRPKGAASSLVDKGFSALRSGNVEEARQCWLAAKELDPENRSLDLNLKKLENRTAR